MTLLSSVQRQFELHDLAIEDADHAHQRPKIEQYGDALFIVARTAQLDRRQHRIRRDPSVRRRRLYRLGPARRLDVLHAGARTTAKAARGRWPGARITSSTPSSTSSSTITPRCSKPSTRKSKRWRTQVLASAMTRAQIERLYLLRRDLLRLRNAVGPLVEVCRRLEHDNLPMVRSTMQPLFRDVTDHVRTVQEQHRFACARCWRLPSRQVFWSARPGDRSLQEAGVMARHHRGPDRDRRHLRHELQAHAGTGVGIRLFWRDRHDPARMRGPILAIPARRLAMS